MAEVFPEWNVEKAAVSYPVRRRPLGPLLRAMQNAGDFDNVFANAINGKEG
jgi:hypothetical protein